MFFHGDVSFWKKLTLLCQRITKNGKSQLDVHQNNKINLSHFATFLKSTCEKSLWKKIVDICWGEGV